MNKPIYKLMDGKGRVLIPKHLRDAAKMEYGSIVNLGLADGKVTMRKVVSWRWATSHRQRWKPMFAQHSNP